MRLRWRRLGHVFCASGEHAWMHSHAAYPVAMPLANRRVRVFFSTRDRDNRSSIAYLELDLNRPTDVVTVCDTPVLSPGERGMFDDAGVTSGCLLQVGHEWWLYYLGWNLGSSVPFQNSIGLACSEDGIHFERFSPAPVLGRNRRDPITVSYPWVLPTDDGLRMWYGSHLTWGEGQNDMRHTLRVANSTHGLSWEPEAEPALPLAGGEIGICRPCVWRHGDGWRMLYSYRGQHYHIGFADSADGQNWHRRDEAVSVAGPLEDWERNAQAYASVFEQDGQHYVLYCGNGYGETGFGIAVMEES